MTYVLDASVAFKWVVAEVDSDKANYLRDEGRRGVHEFVAPDVFLAEVAHALTRSERQKRIAVGDADPLLSDILLTCPILHGSAGFLRQAVAISSLLRVGVYDCIYVALAQSQGCGFVTADDKLVKNLQPTYSFIKHLSSLPSPPPSVGSPIVPPTP
jgi:predicted nucleic acid-binding protein